MSHSFVDLHVHSTASDGSHTPGSLAQLVKEAGLSGFALTDHDTAQGLSEAQLAARRLGLDFIPGIEVSVEHPRPGTLHLLGYGIDPNSFALKELADWQLAQREERNLRILRRLQDLGVAISLEEIRQQAGGPVLGRPHFAAALVRKGYARSVKQAFQKYLAPGAAAYVSRQRLPPRRAIELIHAAGGIVVLAHPAQLFAANDAQLQRIVKDLLDVGLQGIEILHSDHTAQQVKHYRDLAARWRLLMTGGSDFHGHCRHYARLGWANRRRIPRMFMDALLSRIRPGPAGQ